MAHRYAFEAVDRMLRDIMRPVFYDSDSRVFGGLTMLLGGDYRQILPVVPKGKRADIVSSSLLRSNIWQECHVFSLTINMRIRGSEQDSISEFSQWLLNLGDGNLPIIPHRGFLDTFLVKIPNEFLIQPSSDSKRPIVDHTYPSLESNYDKTDYLRDRAILTTTNEIFDEVNDYILSRIPGESKVYLSADRISPYSGNVEEQSLLYPTEYLNTLKFTGVPNHRIDMKVGVPIILLRNINQNMGFCNGTRMVVTKMYARVIEALSITRKQKGKRFLIPRVEITPSKSKWPFSFSRRQFPIKVCFAITINKSQGQTLNNVGIYLPKPVFTRGQLYVAASRVTSPHGLKFLIENSDYQGDGITENVVYKEIFDDVLERMNN